MRATARNLRYLIGRVGTTDHAAFRRLYAMLAPAILASIRAELPDAQQSMHVLRATFCEVWWMSEYHVRYQSTPTDVRAWITGIAQARCIERRRTLNLSRDPSGAAADVLADGDVYDQWTRLQLASMLDGPDTVPRPTTTRGSVGQRRVLTSARGGAQAQG